MSAYRVFLLALLFTASARAAEHDWPASPASAEAPRRLALSLGNRSGIVTAPFFTSAFPEVSGFATVVTPTAAVRLDSVGWLRATLPIGYVRLDFPAGAQVGETALGNVELAVERESEPRVPHRWGVVAALVAPTASQGSETSLSKNRALALSSALTANRHSYLFTPGALGLRFGASIERPAHPFVFRASLDVPVLLRVSDASLPEGSRTNMLGVSPTLELRAAWWATSWFATSLSAALVTDVARLQEPVRKADRERRLQPLLEPSLQFRVGRQVSLALDATIPLGGALGGQAWSVGPNARIDL